MLPVPITTPTWTSLEGRSISGLVGPGPQKMTSCSQKRSSKTPCRYCCAPAGFWAAMWATWVQSPQGRKWFSLFLSLSCTLHYGCVLEGHRASVCMVGCMWPSSYPRGCTTCAGIATTRQEAQGACVNSLHCSFPGFLEMCWKRWSVHLSNLKASYEVAQKGQNGPFQLGSFVMQRNFAPGLEHSVEESTGSLCAHGLSVNSESCIFPITALLLPPRDVMKVKKQPAALMTWQQDLRFKHNRINPNEKKSLQ